MDEEEEEEERRRRRSAGKSSREREKERENVGNRGKSAFSKGEKRAAPTAACCFHKNIFRVFPFPSPPLPSPKRFSRFIVPLFIIKIELIPYRFNNFF